MVKCSNDRHLQCSGEQLPARAINREGFVASEEEEPMQRARGQEAEQEQKDLYTQD